MMTNLLESVRSEKPVFVGWAPPTDDDRHVVRRAISAEPVSVGGAHPTQSFYSAVVGSMTERISEIRLAGKPPSAACRRIRSSLGAMYTQ